MAFITLSIPTLVQHVTMEDRPHYHLRPLFLQHPIATHQRYNRAVSQFQKEVKQLFKGFTMDRDNTHHLLWYLFHPDITYKTFQLGLTISRQYIDGLFNVASFELKGLTIVTLPSINNFMFIATPGTNGKVDLKEECRRVIQKLLKKIKEDQGNDFDASDYFSNKRDFIRTVEVNINIGYAPFAFDQNNDNWFFTRLFEETEFDGAVEIEKVAIDLNSLYPSELGRAYYQDQMVKTLHQTIFQKDNMPIALIGAEGTGKHSVLHEAIWRYQSQYYQKHKGPLERVWQLDPTRVIAGMSIVGMWQKRLEAIIRYIQKPNEFSNHADKIVIDNPVALLRIGKSSQNNMTLSDVLKPYLEKRSLQLLLIATPEEWKIVQEKDRRFSDLFQVIRLQEPSLETATKIVLQKRRTLEIENNCVITIQAINQLFTIQRNYLPNKAMPGSIMKLLLQLAIKFRHQRVDAPEVREEFKVFSGLEERIFDSAQQVENEEVTQLLGQELIGQPMAVKALADVVHLSKAKLADKSKPISSFLFIGPTGVGKTQAAKVLCQYLMGSVDHLIRFDMNEYVDDYALYRLIGDDTNPEGQLTGKVRYQSFGVLLLDEIEKAHPSVHDLLLQVLDDGRLTDSLGRTVDFTNTIIIMTSNLGAEDISRQVGFTSSLEEEAAIYRRAVENYFRPEFINRIDEIIIFNPLELEHIFRIASLQIKELLKRDGFVRRTTILNISPEALEWVAKRGFDARMGGRALRRQIERDLTTLSAEQLIATYNDNPIILNIQLENKRLYPIIQSLDFVDPLQEEWIPELPDETKGKGFYGKLLRNLEELEKHIERYEEEALDEQENDDLVYINSAEVDWRYYDFKEKVAETKEQISTIMLGFRDRYYKEAPAIPLRLKRGHIIPRRDYSTKGVRENFKDRLFQQEALKEISEAYQFAPEQFDSIKSEFIDYYLSVAFLRLMSLGFLRGRSEKITLTFRSAITGMGDWEINYLVEQYQNVLQSLDIQVTIGKDKKSIIAESHSLYDLLQGEEGIHLFYVAHQNPLPIELRLERSNAPQKKQHFNDVLRIYDGIKTITDLRTGFSNAINITTSEFKLLLYGGLDPQLRKRLIQF